MQSQLNSLLSNIECNPLFEQNLWSLNGCALNGWLAHSSLFRSVNIHRRYRSVSNYLFHFRQPTTTLTMKITRWSTHFLPPLSFMIIIIWYCPTSLRCIGFHGCCELFAALAVSLRWPIDCVEMKINWFGTHFATSLDIWFPLITFSKKTLLIPGSSDRRSLTT